MQKRQGGHRSSCLFIFRVGELFVHFCELIFRIRGINVTPLYTLEKFVVPLSYVFPDAFMVITDLIDEIVIGTVWLVLVCGKITI